MKRMPLLLLALSVFALFCACAPKVDITPQMDAARKAVTDAKTSEAGALCPEEFKSAETKLKQAEIFLNDKEYNLATNAANKTVELANMARNCAAAKKAYKASEPVNEGPPQALKEFKHSVFFDYNSNVITPTERKKLDQAVEFLKSMVKTNKFYILISAYTDIPGSAEANLDLARRRALVTHFFLVQNGVPGNLIFMRAWGQEPAMRARGELSSSGGKGKQDPQWRRVDVTVSFENPQLTVAPISGLK